VKSLSALRQLVQVPVFEGFGERVEQQPDVALFEFLMTRFTPFMKHCRDKAVGAHTDIAGPDDEVAGFSVVDLGFLVGSREMSSEGMLGT